MNKNTQPPVHLTSKCVRQILQCGETTLKPGRQLPNFPRHMRTTTDASRYLTWVESEVDGWIAGKIEQRTDGAADS